MTAEEFVKAHEKDFFQTGKKSYEISVTMSDSNHHVHNELEDADYQVKPGDIVLTGTVGEKWCAGLDKVLATYTLPNGSPLTENILKAKQGSPIKVRTVAGKKDCFACRVPADITFKIKTNWAELTVNRSGINHGKGDFLVCNATPDGKPNFAKLRSVNGLVFERTYSGAPEKDKHKSVSHTRSGNLR